MASGSCASCLRRQTENDSLRIPLAPIRRNVDFCARMAEGHIDLAYRLLTQPAYPGWVHWLNQGATPLWKSWDDANSRNHIMFGDISAWFIQVLGGLNPDPAHPGFKRVLFQPQFPENLSRAEAIHHSPHGTLRSAWKRRGDTLHVTLELPEGVEAVWKNPPPWAPTEPFAGYHSFRGSRSLPRNMKR